MGLQRGSRAGLGGTILCRGGEGNIYATFGAGISTESLKWEKLEIPPCAAGG